METIVRGKYVITSARDGVNGILADGAIRIQDGMVAEVGSYASLREKSPRAEVKGTGQQLLMPGLIDAHSHGWG